MSLEKNKEHNNKTLSHLHILFPLSNSLLFPYSFPSLSPSILQSVYLSVSPPARSLPLYLKTHMTLCQILLLDLGGSCAFFLTLFLFFFFPSLRITSNKHKHTVSHRAGTTYTHPDCTVCLCQCLYV